jgi:two-component system chemotaxis sensor kinase CheA
LKSPKDKPVVKKKTKGNLETSTEFENPIIQAKPVDTDKLARTNKRKILAPNDNEKVNDIVAKIIMENSDSVLINKDDSKDKNEPIAVQDKIAEPISEIPTDTEEVDPEFLNDFLVESKEHIENIEMNVLALETDPTNAELINSLFRSFHTIKGLAGFVNQDLVQKIAHQTETRLDKCRKGEAKVSKSFVDLILASSDLLKRICENLSLNREPDFLSAVEIHLENMGKNANLASPDWENLVNSVDYQAIKVDKLGEILIGQGLDPGTVAELLIKQEDYPGLKLGQVAVKEKKADVQDVLQSLRIQEKATNILTSNGGYTRVSALKIDNLVDMIGELVIIQSQIEQDAVKRLGTNDYIVANLLRMEKISKDIQNISMSLRMVSLKSTFQKINRIGRDTIAELGKHVNLEITGEDTEIDRGVAERILDPLVHLIKNSISHGIEEAAERPAKGKSIQGQVKITAYSKRGNVYIEIQDDGKGMDPEQIFQKAIEKKLLDPTKIYSNEEIINVVFMPGFSTAEKVNNVSGRGVGLDVVKTEISRLGGKVEVINRPGQGCSFTLKIPINLAVINGTIIDMLGVRYIIPTLFIKQILKPEPDQWISISSKKAMIRVKENIIPLIPMDKIFGSEGAELEEQTELVVVMELEQKLKALPVRSVVDRREIVVKPLGSEFSHLDYVSGASILGDGTVSLILDVENLFKIGEGKND